MGTYARIQSGVVAELFTPSAGVPIADCFHSSLFWVDVTNVSPRPQPGWTATESGGAWAFSAPAAPASPTLAQQAAALLAAGCAITSTSTPTLSGTYACDTLSQQHVQAEVTSILLNGTFADGTTSAVWLDAADAPHTFTIAEFKALATALAAFVSGCLKVVNGQSTTLPTQPSTIA